MKKLFLFLLINFLFILINKTYSQDGAQLFKTNCAACHTIGKGLLVGPDLKGVNEKFEENWLIEWTQSSQKLVEKGDPLAIEVAAKQPAIMPDMPLTDDQVKAVLSYIKLESGEEKEEVSPPLVNGSAVAPVPAPSSEPVVSPPLEETEPVISQGLLNLIIGAAFFIMLFIILVLAFVIKGLTASLKEK